MAFGLGFNKAKSLSAAEKYVMQGKIPAALQEYQAILQREPRDLVILNTVGDLCLRLNKTDEALTYYYKLAEAYVEDGFVRNAIAVFKKITRTDSGAITAITRLADLYTMQGQLTEARSFYNQAVEYQSQKGETATCIELLEKLYMLDSENLGVRQRLAALYEQAGRREDAAATFLAVAEANADRANPVEAEKALNKARELGSSGPEVLVLQARIQIDGGRGNEAIATLKEIPDRETNKAALNLLFHAHMAAGNLSEASIVAAQIFENFDDFAGLEQVGAMMIERGQIDDALSAYEHVAGRLASQRNIQPLIESLKGIITANPDLIRAREILCKVYEGSGQIGEYSDSSEQLAEALAHQGDFDRARSIYVKLSQMEPTNPQHRRHIQQMDEKMGHSPSPESVFDQAAPAMADDFMTDLQSTPAPPPAEKPLDRDSQEILDNALTESDLQQSYKQYPKAIEALEKALERLPRHITLNLRLVSLYEHTHDWKKAAERCEVLTEAYVMSGDGENATRYGDLLIKYKAAASEVPAQAGMAEFPSVQEFTVTPESAEFPMTAQEAAPAAEEFSMAPPSESPPSAEATREVDLSAEWESLMAADTAVVSEPEAPTLPEVSSADSIVEEIDLYLQTGMIDEAALAFERLRAEAPNHPRFAELQAKVEQAQGGAAQAGPSTSVIEPAEMPVVEPEPSGAGFQPAQPTEPEAAMPVWPEPEPAAPPEEATPAPAEPAHAEEDFALELETREHEGGSFELSLDETAEEPAVAAPPPARPSAPSAPPSAPMGMGDLMGSLDAELADLAAPSGTAPPPPAGAKPAAKAPAPSKGAPAAKAPSTGGLADVFAEFKEEMEVDSAVESDIENHYNMGMAFKEMGLYDEAIGEFQKAYHGAAHLPHYSNFIPCCSLLAHCFLEKNLPELAVTWLEKALKAPDLDRESEMAVRYEIGSAHEMAGHQAQALESFMQVYAMNIDYRDVADRIRSNKGS